MFLPFPSLPRHVFTSPISPTSNTRFLQYHSTPELRDLARVDGGPAILEFDGAAEFWAYSLDTLRAMQTDPEYVEEIQPDEKNFIDGESLKIVVGVDYVVVEAQNRVERHGRVF